MKNLNFPASYAMLSEDEQRSAIGGGFKDSWDSFVENLHMDDFFFSGGLISISISFVPMLLFNLVSSVYRIGESIYRNVTSWFGVRDDTFDALQNYTDEMRAKHQKRGI